MTSLPPNADELVSAYLDGEAAPDEVAMVESNAELMARVESLRSITRQFAAPFDPPPDAQRETHIAAALGAFDELFGAPSAQSTTSTPLAAVPAAPAEATPPTAEPPAAVPPAEAAPGVPSLAATRERRKPRRFNTGLIAAAAAVVLFLGLTVLSVGRGGDDSADLATQADTSADASDAASSDDDAADDAEIFTAADDAAEFEARAGDERSGLSQAEPAPEAAASEAMTDDDAADVGDTADDTAMLDEDDAMEEEAMEEAAEDEAEDEAAGDADAPANDAAAEPAEAPASPPPLPTDFFLGTFSTAAELENQLQRLTSAEVDDRIENNGGTGLFPDCQAEIPELAGDESTLIAEALIGRRSVEVHRVPPDAVDADTPDQRTLLVVDRGRCETISTIDL